MERLIDRSNGFPIYVGKQNPYNAGLTAGEIAIMPEMKYSAKAIVTEVFNALADYQDTNLTPEQITDIQQQIESGELVRVVRCGLDGPCTYSETCPEGCDDCEMIIGGRKS